LPNSGAELPPKPHSSKEIDCAPKLIDMWTFWVGPIHDRPLAERICRIVGNVFVGGAAVGALLQLLTQGHFGTAETGVAAFILFVVFLLAFLLRGSFSCLGAGMLLVICLVSCLAFLSVSVYEFYRGYPAFAIPSLLYAGLCGFGVAASFRAYKATYILSSGTRQQHVHGQSARWK
jgi:hypothetical protein